MQKLMIIGNLTRDPESRAVGDKTVCNFTVAVNRRKKSDGTQEADFFRVGAWGKLGESCQKYLQKGRKVYVCGTVSVNSYTDQQGQAKASMEVFANEVEFLSPAGQSAGEQTPAEPTPVELADGELPF
jgi:single-strand DNA-binding protein